VPNFIEIQNTWCNPFAHLAWNDPHPKLAKTLDKRTQLLWLESYYRWDKKLITNANF